MKRLLLALILLRMSLPVAAQTERATKQERPVWIEVFTPIQVINLCREPIHHFATISFTYHIDPKQEK